MTDIDAAALLRELGNRPTDWEVSERIDPETGYSVWVVENAMMTGEETVDLELGSDRALAELVAASPTLAQIVSRTEDSDATEA